MANHYKQKLKIFLCNHEWEVIAVAFDGTNVRGECKKCKAITSGKIIWNKPKWENYIG